MLMGILGNKISSKLLHITIIIQQYNNRILEEFDKKENREIAEVVIKKP